MKELILTTGLPASGKSTWTKEQLRLFPNKYKRVNRDSLRLMLDNEQFNPKREAFVTKVQRLLILEALDAGFHVIVDDTNLNPKYRKAFEELVKGKAKVVIKDFTDAPLERCIEWDLKREASVGKDVIMKMYNDYLKPKIEPIKHDPNLPSVIICDLDGTLCKMVDRGPFDWQKVDTDVINTSVASVLKNHTDKDGIVIYMSGRDSVCRDKTLYWLKENNMWDDRLNLLYMRPRGDFRKDNIVKEELFDNHIRGKYNVSYILDDRDQVVKMWRGLGLTCFQVNEGSF
jgi:predicted kinase